MIKHKFLLVTFVALSFVAWGGKPGDTNGEAASCGSKYTLLLTGASFATPNNGWFEFGCDDLGATAVNRAVSAESIGHCADKMHNGTLYSKQELEQIDALVIMHVHDRDVFTAEQGLIMEKWEDYAFPFDRGNYAGAYDYVIKRYTADCYNLKFDPASRYYGSPFGKPAVIVLCTHWHDARVRFNTSVRMLAGKWGLPLVEFDRYIGFSKDSPHPVTGSQYSLIYSGDTQQTDGVTYGWHPYSGDTYIQRRMAAIFSHKMKQILPLR